MERGAYQSQMEKEEDAQTKEEETEEKG